MVGRLTFVSYPKVHDESIKKASTIVVYGPGEE